MREPVPSFKGHGSKALFLYMTLVLALHMHRCFHVVESFSFFGETISPRFAKPTARISATRDGLGSFSSAEESNYTLQYSHSFRRHVLRDGDRVVRGFLWLDEALKQFPQAKLLPVQSVELLPGTEPEIAGAGLSSTCTYISKDCPTTTDATTGVNRMRIAEILQSHLKWFPSQVDKLFKVWPEVEKYPADEFEERILFLLAPFPDEAILHQVNYTDSVDWVQQFYTFGRGAGMSAAQVSHALLVLPEFLLRLPQIPTEKANLGHQTAFLYEQTPAPVMVMTQDRLEAWLAGSPTYANVALAYLHWKGWEWTQCRVLLHAWPCLLQPSLEAGWELYERGGGTVRSHLIPEALHCLQMRLQLRPWHLQAMFKTHSRLTGYSATKLREKMDFLQEKLELSSSELRDLLLNMPSLLGTSLKNMQARINFWCLDLGLTASQLKLAAVEKPALLQYSVDANLAPKLAFYTEELGIGLESLVRMTRSYPDIWAYSLQRKLRPSALAFAETCGNMTLNEYGQILEKAPEILRCNWKANLSGKLDFFRERLQLSAEDLKTMIQTTPRVLLQSTNSLQKKICLVEDSFQGEAGRKSGDQAVLQNPSLLMSSPSALQSRIQRACSQDDHGSLMESLTRRGKGRSTRRRRTVLLLAEDGDSVERKFDCVGKAAKHAGISVSNMYNVIRHERPLHGRKYVYSSEALVSSNGTEKEETTDPIATMKRDLSKLYSHESEPQTSRLTIEVSGCAFPPEAGVRGRRRAGGMALHVPVWSMNDWQEMCTSIWNGRKFRVLQDRRTVILGYPYLRPSRPRCSLYACLEAVRAATVWLKSVTTPLVEIEIRSDSNYAIDLLQNMTQVLEWGEPDLREKFTFTGEGPLYKANPDILYPVSRALYHLVHQETESSHSRIPEVSIRFTSSDTHSDINRRARAGAKLAAQLMYESR